MKKMSLLSSITRKTAPVAVLLFSPCFALAQSTASTPADQAVPTSAELVQLDPYKVSTEKVVGWNSQMTFSGSRTAKQLLDIPVNISIITDKFLQDIGAANFNDVVQYAASGVTNRVTYRDDLVVRGYRQAALRDGLANTAASGLSSFYDVERVEIVKGPTALVFGSYTNVSGTVNLVTKRPTAIPQGEVSLTAGNYGRYIASFTQRGPLNRDGSVRYRVTVGAQDYSGWVGKGTDANEYDNNRVISGSVDWTVNDKLEFRLDLGQNYQRARAFQYGYIDPATNQVWSGSANGFSTSADWEYRKNEAEFVRLDAIYKLTSELAFRAVLRSSRSLLEYSSSWPTGTIGGLQLAEAPNYQLVKGRINNFSDVGSTVYTTNLDASWSHSFGKFENMLNAGWEYLDSRGNSFRINVPLGDLVINAPVSARPGRPPETAWTPAIYVPRTFPVNAGWTGYVQDSVTLLHSRLILSAGLRYVSTTATAIPGKTATVPNYSALYKLNPNISAYVSKSESYSPVTGVDAFGTPRRDTIGETEEVGLKFNALKERLFGTITYFDMLVDPVNRQIQAIHPVTGQLIFGSAQVGRETNQGVEVDLGYVHNFAAGDWSTFVTGYKAEPKDANGVAAGSVVTDKYTVFTKYEFTSGPLKSFLVGGGISYIGEMPGTGFPLMPSYTLSSLVLGYQLQKWRLALNVDNLEDKRGIIVGNDGGKNFLQVNSPRTYKVSVRRAW